MWLVPAIGACNKSFEKMLAQEPYGEGCFIENIGILK